MITPLDLMFIFIIITLVFLILWYLDKRSKRPHLGRKKYLNRSEQAIDTILMKLAEKYGGIEMSDIMLMGNGSSSQIDNMLLTQKALYVIEVKDYSGWIYGSPNQQYWTQVFTHYKSNRTGKTVSKFKLYNPIKQNAGHISMLKRLTQVHKLVPVYNIVVFTHNALLKDVKSGSSAYVVYISGLAKQIMEIDNGLYNQISPYEQAKIYDAILYLDIDDSELRIQHIRRIRDKYNN